MEEMSDGENDESDRYDTYRYVHEHDFVLRELEYVSVYVVLRLRRHRQKAGYLMPAAEAEEPGEAQGDRLDARRYIEEVVDDPERIIREKRLGQRHDGEDQEIRKR